jgi:O-glycosyl hydrolase
MEAFEKLKALVVQAEPDVMKVDEGNRAAGTRVRKFMQEIKGAAQEVRIKILEAKATPPQQ